MNRDEKLSDDDIEEILAKDYLSRNAYLNNFFHAANSINKNTVLALDGKWGSGKTVFARQLISANKEKQYKSIDSKALKLFKEKYDIFYYNAWGNDSLVPLESVLIKLSEDLWGKEKAIANKVLKIVKGIANVGLKLGTDGALGVDDFNYFSEKYLDDYVKKSKRVLGIHEEINAIIDEACEKHKKRLLFIIDDLDRCKPSFAVELLETLKHDFYNSNLVILICANNEQLQHTIKKYYGEDFNGLEYLDRFYDLVFRLPDPNIDSYVKYYLKVQDTDYIHRRVAADIAKYKNMSLRQIKRYFSTLELLADFFEGRSLEHDEKCGRFVKYVCIPIALYLRTNNIEDFEKFIHGNGEIILKDFSKNCPEIGIFERELAQDNKDVSHYYNEMFDERTSHYASRDAFMKTYSMLGFSSVIDEDPYSSVDD